MRSNPSCVLCCVCAIYHFGERKKIFNIVNTKVIRLEQHTTQSLSTRDEWMSEKCVWATLHQKNSFREASRLTRAVWLDCWWGERRRDRRVFIWKIPRSRFAILSKCHKARVWRFVSEKDLIQIQDILHEISEICVCHRLLVDKIKCETDLSESN